MGHPQIDTRRPHGLHAGAGRDRHRIFDRGWRLSATVRSLHRVGPSARGLLRQRADCRQLHGRLPRYLAVNRVERRVKPILEVAARLGLRDEDLILFGNDVAKVELGALRRPRARTDAPHLVLVSAITPTPAGRGQDHDQYRPRRRALPSRTFGLPGIARALARPLPRHEGRCDRRRRRAPGAGDPDQPSFHGRLSRHHECTQPSRRARGQPSSLRRCAAPRSASDPLATGSGHERSRTSKRHGRAGRRRRAARDRLRHHRGLRGDGDALSR